MPSSVLQGSNAIVPSGSAGGIIRTVQTRYVFLVLKTYNGCCIDLILQRGENLPWAG
jgi:hypothetical protein